MAGSPEDKCKRCGHERRVHSKDGCVDFDMQRMKECPCKVKYTDRGMFG